MVREQKHCKASTKNEPVCHICVLGQASLVSTKAEYPSAQIMAALINMPTTSTQTRNMVEILVWGFKPADRADCDACRTRPSMDRSADDRSAEPS